MAETLTVLVRRRPRRKARRCPEQLHIFDFRLAPEGLHPRFAIVLVRGKMGQNAAIGHAYEQARLVRHSAEAEAVVAEAARAVQAVLES